MVFIGFRDPNFSKANPNFRGPGQRKSKTIKGNGLDFLGGFELFQWVAPTPMSFFLFIAPLIR
jgi:hypothetical protein